MSFQIRRDFRKSCIKIFFSIWEPFSYLSFRVFCSSYSIQLFFGDDVREINQMVFTEFSSSLSLIAVYCHPDCLTCSQSPEHCVLCQDPTKLLRNGRCVHSCGPGFYQAGALCLGMAPSRASRGGQRLTAVKEGVLDAGNAQLPNHYQIIKPSIGYSASLPAGLFLLIFYRYFQSYWQIGDGEGRCLLCSHSWIFHLLKDSNIRMLGVIY